MQQGIVAAQMYTVREFAQNTEQYATALHRVRQLGYTAVAELTRHAGDADVGAVPQLVVGDDGIQVTLHALEAGMSAA